MSLALIILYSLIQKNIIKSKFLEKQLIINEFIINLIEEGFQIFPF